MDSGVDIGLIQELQDPAQTLILENYVASVACQAKVEPMPTSEHDHQLAPQRYS